MNKLEERQNYTNETFEDIKHFDENGTEYWEARELMKILEYNKWENFEKVINKAKEACENSNISVVEHFPDVRKLSKRANNAHYEVGSKIKNTIKELGGTMPEDLPTPKKSLKQLEREHKKALKK